MMAFAIILTDQVPFVVVLGFFFKRKTFLVDLIYSFCCVFVACAKKMIILFVFTVMRTSWCALKNCDAA
jgi:hypothetical protein